METEILNVDIIIGQEAVCSDGLGRVADVERHSAGTTHVKIDTYYNNRGCYWDISNIRLCPIIVIKTDKG